MVDQMHDIRTQITEAIADEVGKRVKKLGIDLAAADPTECKRIYQGAGVEKYYYRDTCILTVQLQHTPTGPRLIFDERG